MALEIWTFETLKAKAQEDQMLNGDKYRHQLAVAKAWLKSGGRLTLHRWAMRRDFETHLVLDGDTVLMVECDGARGSFCRLDGLMYDEFLMIPDTHEIGENTPYPTWIYGDLEVPQMRITK